MRVCSLFLTTISKIALRRLDFMQNTILQVNDVSLNYYDKNFETKALQSISFNVLEGEFVSIVGPSGCGKSSLLSIIAGLLTECSGEVLVTDNMAVGYMLQKDYLFEWRTIWQNTLLGLEVQNILTEEKKDYVTNLLKKYELYEFKDHKPSQLSGGMRQRAALIRTLAIEPKILLLDEPFSALDYQNRLAVSDEIASIIKTERKTAILVTHDIAEAVSLSDRVIVLSKRPAVVKSIHETKFSQENLTAIEKRETAEFRKYFNNIWKELEQNVV